MRASDKAEEILETLWITTKEKGKEVTSFKDLAAGKVSPEVEELLSLNCIALSEDGARLTKKGMGEAESVIRRHRLAERLTVDVFDLKTSLMEETACRFEHLLSKEVEESICTLLGHPRFCPHDKPIPPGRCCKESLKTPRSIVTRLSDVGKGAKGKVAYLHTKDNKKLQKLMAMGVLPGVIIEVIQTFPSFVFRIGNAQIATDQQMAEDVFIRSGK